MRTLLLSLASIALLSACSSNYSSDTGDTNAMADKAVSNVMGKADSVKLATVLASQPEDAQARFAARNPQETLEFFGIAPGMTVVEALPGGGWYSKILLPYLGRDGTLIGADYAQDMYPLFGFFSAERLEAKKTWVPDWTAQAESWRDENAASVAAFQFGSMPNKMSSTADAVVFIRALHNLKRFEEKGFYLSKALVDAHKALKPGGILGIVQHRISADAPAEMALGNRGYLKQAELTTILEAAGFKFVAASEINANPKDRPAGDDIVWRLPPNLVTSGEDAALRDKMLAIGESDRMTLKFVKK